MVERMLATETNFFDHNRLLSLGETTEPAEEAPRLTPRRLRAVPRSERLAVPGPIVQPRLAMVLGVGPPAQGPKSAEPKDAAPLEALSPERAASEAPAAAPAATPEGGPAGRAPAAAAATPEGEPAERAPAEPSAEAAPKASPEPRWLTLMRWLTRLCVSLIFVVWIFILGFFVGRGTINESLPGVAWLESLTRGEAEEYPEYAEEPAEEPDMALARAGSLAAGLLAAPETGASGSAASGGSGSSGPSGTSGTPGTTRISLAAAATAPAIKRSLEAGEAMAGELPSRSTPPAGPSMESWPDAAEAVRSGDTPEDQGDLELAQGPSTVVTPMPAGPRPPATAVEPAAPAQQPVTEPVAESRPEPRPEPAIEPPAETAPEPPAQATAQAPAQAQAPADDDSDLFWPAKPGRSGRFTVQVASVKSEAEARAATERYIAKGFEAYFYRTESGRFPVRVGRYETEEQANIARQALIAAGAQGPYVSKLK
jgi:cell division septation protein DedD